MSGAEQIKNGKAVIGIEFGSTRIKAVLIGEDHVPLAAGVHDWQNELADGHIHWKVSEQVSRTALPIL